ncbi:MAG: hypothetical protein M3331_00070 [Actinomycetota bacterium]|nr:hypothetical protein [Actinomycetota bacterium]
MPAETRTPRDAREAVASHDSWYHTMDVAPGVETPGWFDLRPILDHMPWPDLRGKRCLEVGPYDGHLSFEMERRGASEVVAADIGSPWEWDWPLKSKVSGPQAVAAMSGERTGNGFLIAKAALGSAAERVEISAYDLSPHKVGVFDFVICGSLMLHLREPIRALESIRSVCSGKFLSAETISVRLAITHPRRAAARFRGGDRCQWWIPNPAAHGLMLEAAGFEVERAVRPYAIPLGPTHPSRDTRLKAPPEHLLAAPVTRGVGVPHSALLSRPTADAAQ